MQLKGGVASLLHHFCSALLYQQITTSFSLRLPKADKKLRFSKPPRAPSSSLPPTLSTIMTWLRKALRHGPVVTSGQAALSTSALMPDSNLASTEASSAASAAAAELFHSLDFVLDQFGDEG